MTLERYTDILILGCDLPGLIAGAFLAKRGLSVSVLKFPEKNYFQQKNLQPVLVSHLHTRLFKTILGRLSIADSELGITQRASTPYQIILPGHRIDVSIFRERFYRELQREFKDQTDLLKNFYLKLDQLDLSVDSERLQQSLFPRGFLDRIKWWQFVKNYHLDFTLSDGLQNTPQYSELRCLIEAQAKFLTSFYSEELFAYPLAKLLANENYTLYEVKGGVDHLKQIFLSKIESYSGKIITDFKLEKLIWRRRKVIGADLGSLDGLLKCRFMIFNQFQQKLVPYLPQNFFGKWNARKLAVNRPKFVKISLHYKVDEQVVPVGMKNHVLWIKNPSEFLIGNNFLHLYFLPMEKKESNQRDLVVTYQIPVELLERQEVFFESLHQEITIALHELMPFSQGRLVLCFPKPSREDGDDTVSEEVPDYTIFRSGAFSRPVYEVRASKFFHLFPFLHRPVFYQNLIFSGSEVLSALGLEGDLMLGLKTTDLVWHEFEGSKKRAIRQRNIA